MAFLDIINEIRITSTTLWSFVFSAAAHSVVIGSIYYARLSGNAIIQTEITSRQGYNSIAHEFLPSQEERFPDAVLLGNQNALVLESSDVPLSVTDEYVARKLDEISTAPLESRKGPKPLSTSISNAKESASVTAVPFAVKTSEKSDPQKRPIEKSVDSRGDANGLAKKEKASLDHVVKKIGPKQDFIPGQLGSLDSPPGTPDGKASFHNTIPTPQYPDQLRKTRVEGTVLVEIHVATDGHFKDFRIKQSSGQPLFDAAVMNSMRQASRAKPAIKDGAPVETIEVVPFVFQLKK